MSPRGGARPARERHTQRYRVATDEEAASFRAHIQRRVAVLRDDSLAPSTKRQKCSHWQTWLRFCTRSKLDPDSFASLENPKAENRTEE